MASAPPVPAQPAQPQQQQQQQQEPPKHPAHPLDNLQAMMNLVLVSSGRYMKTVKQAPADSARMQSQLKGAVAAGSERFQDSLDELEKDILHAQAVLRRDLALMKAERKKKEAAAKEQEAEKARIAAAESSAKRNASPQKDVAPAPPAPMKPSSPPPAKIQPAEPPKTEPPTQVAEIPTKNPSPPPADVPMEHADNPNTAQESEFDFDSMFGDGAMDTSGNAANEQVDLNLDPGTDLSFSLDEQPSLLRGLEHYAKAGTDDNSGQNNVSTDIHLDFDMTDMPDLNTSVQQQEQPPPPPPPPQQQQQQPSATKPQSETMAQQPTAADDPNLNAMTNDNIDDLFDLDYENPEATQFDDAFFGFEGT